MREKDMQEGKHGGGKKAYVCVSPFGAANHETPQKTLMKMRPMRMLQLECAIVLVLRFYIGDGGGKRRRGVLLTHLPLLRSGESRSVEQPNN